MRVRRLWDTMTMRDDRLRLQVLADKTRPVSERVAAAEALGRPARMVDEAWSLLCTVLRDPKEDAQVRIAAASALSRRNRAAAPNQLSRYLDGDDDRRVRAHVALIFSNWGSVPVVQEPGLRRDLDALRDQMSSYPLVNLALTYGGDERVVDVLTQARHHGNPEIRGIAIGGLGMLGLLDTVLGALDDAVPSVRARAAETLGYYGLKTPEEISALETALQDVDSSVQQAATTALHRLGAMPLPKIGRRTQSSEPAAEQRVFVTSSGSAGEIAFDKPAASAEGDEWRPFLEKWSRQWLNVHEYAVELPEEVFHTGWLGRPGATEHEIHGLEQRLGCLLPPSYRAFLELTNGWRRTTPFIEGLLPTTDIDYFRVRNQDWIDILLETATVVTPEEHARYGADQDELNYRAEYLWECIEISQIVDSTVYLLNPAVVTLEGEWEAWVLASWDPGVRRYRSFWDLMQAEHDRFVELEKP